MKNIHYLSGIIVSAIILVVLAGCDGEMIPVTGISLDEATVIVGVGGTTFLKAVVEPADATDKDVEWTSDNDAIAAVSPDGVLIGITEGTTSVNVISVDGNFSASCEVEVVAVRVAGLWLNLEQTDLFTGATKQLVPIISPPDAHNQDVNWESADALIADVDEYGQVTGRLGGETVITVTSGDTGLTADCRIAVNWTPASWTVESHGKISDTDGAFSGILDNNDYFGTSICVPGDIDGDGTPDLAVGAFGDDDGGFDRGAVWLLFMSSDGTVANHQKISSTEGGFSGVLDDFEIFGTSVCSLGDLNGDGITDLAVGAVGDNDGGSGRGAVWVLFLNSDGTVSSHQKISDTEGDFSGILSDNDCFGESLCSPGDLDGDGTVDLVVGSGYDDDGGTDRGALWVLFLNSDGTVSSHQKISDTSGGFEGILDDNDSFGWSLTSLGDLNGDGISDIAAGADGDDDGGTDRGAIWVLFLNVDGTVASHQKISSVEGEFTGVLDDSDIFGVSINSPGDLNGDDVNDLIAGAYGDDDGGSARGAVWILFLRNDGTIASHRKISSTEGRFTGMLENGDFMGKSVCSPGDLDGNGTVDIAVGARFDDDGGEHRGALWMLFINED